MKTNYPLDKIVRRRNEVRRRFAVALTAILLISFLVATSGSIRRMINGSLIFLTKPLWVVEDEAWVLRGDLLAFLRSHKGLVEENRQLKTDIAKLKLELASSRLIKEEYEKIAAVVGRSWPDKDQPVLGKVIVKPNRSPYDLVVIDIGEEASGNIAVGQLAALSPEVAVGRVVAVVGKTSTVQLFSSPGLSLPVLLGPDRLQATSTGQGGGMMAVELPRGLTVTVGDEVILPTRERLLVGQVIKVVTGTNQPTQKILISLPINIYNLGWLEIYES